MFYPREGGSAYEVEDNAFGFVFKCQVPPLGYGVNSMTGELCRTDMFQRSDVAEEQYFERVELPIDYKERRRREVSRQNTAEPLYVDPYLEDFRKAEWNRRLCGVWFLRYNPNLGYSEWVYITGQHWLYLNWWIYQGKKLDYREVDKETFYIYAYCQEDPCCLGSNELTQRKSGKTARTGCVAYERTSRMSYHHCGLQSKGDKDAASMFKKAFVQPWRKLPHFYRPVYDLMKGDDPSETLSFFATSRKGQAALEDEKEEALESFIDFGTSEEGFYDGPELHTYISDETGKTRRQVSVKERMRVVRQATEIDGEIRGFHMSTTTVEVEEGEEENEEYQQFTAQSNGLVRNENGMTSTGYYTFFQPADKYGTSDVYGFVDGKAIRTRILNQRKHLEEEGDLRGLSSYKRKVPLTFKEAFSADGTHSLYNPELLNNQLDAIQWTNKFTERGDLVWEDGYKIKKPVKGSERMDAITGMQVVDYEPSKVLWVANPNGKFEKVAGWLPIEPNNVYLHGFSYAPNNKFRYKQGCDPFKYDKTKEKRRSNCASFVYQMADDLFPNKYDDMFVLRYAYREEGTSLANEDILKMAWWCGCEVLFERNINHWKKDFNDWECSKFYSWMPGEVEPGLITATGSSGVQSICNYTEAYINKYVSKVFFKTLLNKNTGWLGFKVEDTEKFDEPMAAGITLIAVKGQQQKIKPMQKDIGDYISWMKTA